MCRLYRASATALTASALMAAALGAAQAQVGVSTPPEVPPPVEPAVAAAAAPAPKFEGALGLVLGYRPAFSGSSDRKISPQLAGFIRYRRFTLTGAGGFTTRRQDDVERGLDAKLLRRDRERVNLSLR